MRHIYILSVLLIISWKSIAQGDTDQVYHVAKRSTATSYKITDIDGNEYDTIKIGSQVWFKENLTTTRYRDGYPIAEAEDSAVWARASRVKSPAWCYYNCNKTNNPTYGKLYNWYAVSSAHHVCPTGWHVPSDSEFTVLADFLGGKIKYMPVGGGGPGWNDIPGSTEIKTDAGGKMKAMNMWAAPDRGATNLSRFTALPAGGRRDGLHMKAFGKTLPDFEGLHSSCAFWTSTSFNNIDGFKTQEDHIAWFRSLSNADSNVYRQHNFMGTGSAVRCMED